MATRRPPARVDTIRDLTADPQNARRHSARNLQAIAMSLRKVGTGRSIVIDGRNVVLAGNGTIQAAAEVGIEKVRVIDAAADEIIAVRRVDLSAQQKAELAVYDNRTAELAEWDAAALAGLVAEGLALSPMFSDDEIAALGLLETAAATGAGAGEASATLRDRFGVPPFSILDARQGYWQDRKRAWLALGIQSELGRGAGTWVESEATGSPMDRQRAMSKRAGKAAPGGSARPAMKLKQGRTQRGDGRGRAIS